MKVDGVVEQLVVEQWVVEVCRELKLPVGSLDDDIFEIGGTSLTVIRLAERISSHFGAVLDPEDILESSTLRDIAKTISTKAAEAQIK